MMLCQHCDAFVSTANDAPRCACCGERVCPRCAGDEKHSQAPRTFGGHLCTDYVRLLPGPGARSRSKPKKGARRG